MAAAIEIIREAGSDPLRFRVRVADERSATTHRVTIFAKDSERLAPGREPEAVIAAAFRFLLEREAKESILPRFDISVIARYFSDFETRLPRYLAGE